jgi:hypothetical protein
MLLYYLWAFVTSLTYSCTSNGFWLNFVFWLCNGLLDAVGLRYAEVDRVTPMFTRFLETTDQMQEVLCC